MIKNIIVDLNGTLSVQGVISDHSQLLIKQLLDLSYNIVLISGDLRGNAALQAEKLGIDFLLAKSSEEKEARMKAFKKEETAAIGNARIDIGTFKRAKISIATLQSEGIHTGILKHVDIIVPSIEDALNLFIDTKSLEATLRT